MRKLHTLLSVFLIYFSICPSEAQETMRNVGKMQMHVGSKMGFYGDFTNERVFSNNIGSVYFVGSALQTIQGFLQPLQFEKVVLDNSNSILLRVPVFNSVFLEFKKGVISTPKSTPSVNWTFEDNSTYMGASDARHIFGYAAKIGNDSFAFPIGDGQRLRLAAISKPNDITAKFNAAYFKGNPTGATLPTGAPFPTTVVNDKDLTISNTEYWDIDGNSPVRLTLTWNVQSQTQVLAQNDISRLVVAAWDGTQWISLGATSISGDLVGQGSVTSRLVVPDSFKVFTLGVVKASCFANVAKLDVGSDRILCYNDTLTLKAGSSFKRYQWQDGSADSNFVVRKAGKYWVKAWDICGNSQTDLLQITAPRPIKTTAIPTKCFGETNGGITLSDTANVQIKINSFTRMSYQIQALGVGSYQLTVLPAEGCMIDTLIEIRQASAHSIEIGKDTVHINQRQILSLEAKPSAGFTPVSVNWTPPQYVSCDTCFKTTAKPAGKTTFTVHALDSLGCTLKDEIVVYVDKKDDLYIPNAFNPEKEEFTVLGTSAVEKVLKMQIFDRWGTLLYEAQNFKPDGSIGWNGSFRNQHLMRGTYVVTVEVEFINKEIKSFASEFLLTR